MQKSLSFNSKILFSDYEARTCWLEKYSPWNWPSVGILCFHAGKRVPEFDFSRDSKPGYDISFIACLKMSLAKFKGSLVTDCFHGCHATYLR